LPSAVVAAGRINYRDGMSTSSVSQWVYLNRKPGSLYRQLFIKGRNIAARTLYGHFLNDLEPRTMEQIAQDYQLPLEAVREAIAYCESNPPEIQEDWEAEEELEKATGMKDPDYRKHGKTKRLSVDEMARISRS
jgi:uncharacterized protein (DUF433 family)